MTLSAEAYAILEGRHSDPFRYLGLHPKDGRNVVRAFLPHASQVEAIDEQGHRAELSRLHDAGLFEGELPKDVGAYRLRANYGDNVVELHDPYRFPPVLSDFDLYLLGEGRHQDLYDKLGAHPMTMEGVRGIAFVVFAPNAKRVSVVGDFNYWDNRPHAMRVRGNGYWEIFIPGVTVGSRYKFDIAGPHGEQLPLKADPLAFQAEIRPNTASIVFDESKLSPKMAHPAKANALTSPMSIYEVHLGSWRRRDGNEWLTYRELAETLPKYARDMGFTHIELLPISRPACLRRRAASARLMISRRSSRPAMRKVSRCCSTGCPGTSPTTATASDISMVPRFTSMPTRCRAAISTGVR